MFHYHDGDFPYSDRFPSVGLDAPVSKVYIPEWDLTVCRDHHGYLGDPVCYYTSDRHLFECTLRESAVLPGKNEEKLNRIPYLHDGTYLYNDEDHVFYFHFYFAGKHYAVPPDSSFRLNTYAEKYGLTYYEIETDLFSYRFFGIEVDSFEGEERWANDYKDSIVDDCMVRDSVKKTEKYKEWFAETGGEEKC